MEFSDRKAIKVYSQDSKFVFGPVLDRYTWEINTQNCLEIFGRDPVSGASHTEALFKNWDYILIE